jgi:hypothetical protein
MPNRFFFSSKVSLLALTAALVLGTAAPVFAQAATEEPSEMQKFFGAIGLLDLPKDPIDYNERSPLVVPPSADLPKPGGVSAKQLNPEWPVDQDIKDARVAAKEAKKPIDFPNDTFYNGANSRLSIDEMTRKGAAGSGKAGTVDVLQAEKEHAVNGEYRLTTHELGFKGWGHKQEMTFTKEPERTSLLQPPPGYRTPSANAPYGIVEDAGAYKVNGEQDVDPNKHK